MIDTIKLYSYSKNQLLDMHFYEQTSFNIIYKKRKLIICKKNELCINSYFLMEEFKKELDFTCLYIAGYTQQYLEDFDSDFETGINNIAFDYEKQIMGRFVQRGECVYIIFREGRGLHLQKLSEENFCTMKWRDIKYFLISEMEFEIEEKLLNEYMAGDLELVFQMLKKCSCIVERVSYYSNYNLMVYFNTYCEDEHKDDFMHLCDKSVKVVY